MNSMTTSSIIKELIKEYGFMCQRSPLLKFYQEKLRLPLMWDWGGNPCKYEWDHIHHIDRDRTNNDIDNLIPLCQWCHECIHHGWPVELSDGRSGTFNIFTYKMKYDKTAISKYLTTRASDKQPDNNED